MYNYINNIKSIKVSNEYISLYKKICTASNILSQKLMKEPSVNELAMFLEVNPLIIDNVIKAMNKVDSLEKIISNDGKDLSLLDTIRDDRDFYNIDYMLDDNPHVIEDCLLSKATPIVISNEKTPYNQYLRHKVEWHPDVKTALKLIVYSR